MFSNLRFKVDFISALGFFYDKQHFGVKMGVASKPDQKVGPHWGRFGSLIT